MQRVKSGGGGREAAILKQSDRGGRHRQGEA